MDHRYPATTAERSPRTRHHHPTPARPDGRAVATWPPGPSPATGRPGPAAAPGRHRPSHRRPARSTGLAPLAAGALAAALPAVPALAAQAPPAAAPAAMVLQATAARPAAEAPVRLVAPLAPVPADAAPEPPQLRVSDLLKAAGLTEAARERAEREDAARCDADLDGLGAVKPWVREGARFLSCLYDEPTLHGVASRGGNYSDHPSGHAVDLMTGRQRGDRIAECTLANQDELGVDYVIWRQRVNYGDGWEPMADRGGATANHFDHVHISFERSAPDGDPSAGRCD